MFSYLFALSVLISGSYLNGASSRLYTLVTFGLTLLAIFSSPFVFDFQLLIWNTSLSDLSGASYFILWGIFGYFIIYQSLYPKQRLLFLGPFLGAACALVLFYEANGLFYGLFQLEGESLWINFLLWIGIKQPSILIGLGVALVLTRGHKTFPWMYVAFYLLIYIVLLEVQLKQDIQPFLVIETLKQFFSLLLTCYMVYVATSKSDSRYLTRSLFILGSIIIPSFLSAGLEFYSY